MTESTLSGFQRRFASALLASPEMTDDPLAAQPAFSVYRNTVMKGCIDALEANFPAVARLVGRDWFRAAAALHVAQTPPREPRLLHYGQDFPAFLRGFAPAASLPYLPAVAELDRTWADSHAAADASPLPADALAPEALGALRLTPHPAARWRWFDDMPVHSLWSRNRVAPDDANMHHGELACDLGDIVWQGEGSLLTRPLETVEWCALSAGGCALLDACAAGAPLAEAAGAALDTEPGCDLVALLALLLRQGAFTDI